MSDVGEFNLESLFASRVPEPAQARVINRAKYDFAIAYPDPETVPTEALAECVREAVAEEGRELAIYPHDQGYPPLREYVARKLGSRPGHRDRTGQYPPRRRLQPAEPYPHRGTDRPRRRGLHRMLRVQRDPSAAPALPGGRSRHRLRRRRDAARRARSGHRPRRRTRGAVPS